jgi:hypothetical protein
MPASDYSVKGLVSAVRSTISGVFIPTSDNPSAETTSGSQAADDLPTCFNEQDDMESGRFANKEMSAALSSNSNVVPFSAAPSPSKPSTFGRLWFTPAPPTEPEDPDLEASPEPEIGEKRAELEGKERKAPEDLV